MLSGIQFRSLKITFLITLFAHIFNHEITDIMLYLKSILDYMCDAIRKKCGTTNYQTCLSTKSFEYVYTHDNVSRIE